MMMWVNKDGVLVTPYINLPIPSDFFVIELTEEETKKFNSGVVLSYVDGKIVERTDVTSIRVLD